MESEAIEAQDVSVEEVAMPAQAEGAPQEAPQADEPVGEEAAPEAATETPAAEAVSEADDGAESVEQPAEDAPDVVATEDVAPAQSRMELARLAKESLVERARALVDSTDWRATSDAQRALMDEWRRAGYAGKQFNDKLWEDFRAARQEFFSKREEQVVSIKRQIIDEAHEIASKVGNWGDASQKLDALMDRWKQAGNSGSESDKELWEEFNTIRRDFRNRRKADSERRRATQRANADAKRAIVDEAKAIAASEQYTRENSERMRQLNADYKAIGFAGRPANDELWAEFGKAKHSYWDGNSKHMDERRKRSSERLQEVVERKEDQIEHLKTQNETLTTRLGSTLDPNKIAQIKSWIAQNEERSHTLAEDIDDIKRRI